MAGDMKNVQSRVRARLASCVFDCDAAAAAQGSKRAKSLSSCSTSTTSELNVDMDPLDLRWSILKQLLPRSSQVQVEKDDLLKLVFEYVQDLETQIQAFRHEGSINNTGMPNDQEVGALQKKGLCIVSLSKLTRAF